MKFGKIASLLKKSGTIAIINTYGGQWISDGAAVYPVYELPELSKDNIFGLLDIPTEKRGSHHVYEQDGCAPIRLDDTVEGERLIKAPEYAIRAWGKTMMPLITSQGAVYINTAYLSPLSDADGNEFYERTAESGETYIAIKKGFALLAAVMPCLGLVTRNFADTLSTLSSETHRAAYNMAARERERQVDMEYDADETGEEETEE